MPLLKDINKWALFDKLGYKVHHPRVRDFHNSQARLKVACAPARTTKSYCAAKDVLPYILSPDTRGWIVGPSYCADSETEILTGRGWLKWNEIMDDDICVQLREDGRACWGGIRTVHSFVGEHDMIRMNWRGHDSFTTSNHRWRVGYTTCNPKRRTLGYRFTTTEKLIKPNEFIPCAVPVEGNDRKIHHDGFVELVAWYWTEGHNQKHGNGVIISQNRENSGRINKAAQSWLGDPKPHMRAQRQIKPSWVAWKESKYSPSESSFKSNNPRCGVVRFNSIAGAFIRSVCPDKVVSPEFIMQLTQDQLELFIEVSVLADGHERLRGKPSGKLCKERVVVQKRKEPLDSLQMVCQLAGYQTYLSWVEANQIHVLRIFERNIIWPGQKPQLKNHNKIRFHGTVWCPETEHQTWLARRNGTVYFTGNTLAEKEFRYIYEDLVLNRNLLGLPPPDQCLNSAGSGKLFIKWPWGAVVEGKSCERPESLLGEAIDWVIYSEAAQMPRKIREKYVSARVITRKGIEIVPTTPEGGGEWVFDLFEKGNVENTESIESFHWDITANPLYDRSEFERAKRIMGEDNPAFQEQYLGIWAFYGGLVYKGFRRDLHVIEPFQIPRNWPRYRAMDFGHTDPTVCLFAAVGPSHEIYIYDEYHNDEGLPTKEHIYNIKEKTGSQNISRTVGDPSAAQLIDDYCSEGLSIFRGNNDRLAGRLRVAEYLNPVEHGPMPWPRRDDKREREKYPNIYFFNTCKNTIREFLYFRWCERPSVKQERTREQTEGDDHCLDSLRYLLMDRPAPHQSVELERPGTFAWHMKQIQEMNRPKPMGGVMEIY